MQITLYGNIISNYQISLLTTLSN